MDPKHVPLTADASCATRNLANLRSSQLLICPECRNALDYQTREIVCSACGKRFSVEGGLPVMAADYVPASGEPKPQAKTETFERIPIENFSPGDQDHVQDFVRYQFATKFVKGRVVVDAACGTGYGTRMLASAGGAGFVLGVDLAMAGLSVGVSQLTESNAGFTCGSVKQLPLRDESVDVVVSFETFEHIPEVGDYLDEVRRILKVDGIAVISTPLNELESRFTPSNPFHVREYSSREFQDLLASRFGSVRLYSQLMSFKDDLFDNPIGASKPVDGVRSLARSLLPLSVRRLLRRVLRSKGRRPLDSEIVEGANLNAGVQIAICSR